MRYVAETEYLCTKHLVVEVEEGDDPSIPENWADIGQVTIVEEGFTVTNVSPCQPLRFWLPS